MTHETYKSWLDAMPIDDVRRKIERLERKLADLQMLERLYAERHGGGEGEPDDAPVEADGKEVAQDEAPAVGEADHSQSGGEAGEHGHGEG